MLTLKIKLNLILKVDFEPEAANKRTCGLFDSICSMFSYEWNKRNSELFLFAPSLTSITYRRKSRRKTTTN